MCEMIGICGTALRKSERRAWKQCLSESELCDNERFTKRVNLGITYYLLLLRSLLTSSLEPYDASLHTRASYLYTNNNLQR